MYTQTFSRSTPGCIVFLIDRSDSMGLPWAGSNMTLAQGAARAINKILLELVIRSIKEAGVAPRTYFYVGCYGYGFCPSTGGEGVESVLPGQLASRAIVPLPELADQPLTMREEPSVDATPVTSRVPIWVEPYSGYRTPMCKAIADVGSHVYQWAANFPDSFPPIVINITDGMVTDSPYQGNDLAGWASLLTNIETSDGKALLLNVFLSPSQQPVVAFPTRADRLPEPGPLLFSISSLLPDPMVRNARSAQIDVEPGARGLMFNANLTMLVKFLEIGTRFEVLHG